ncbi:hypothetical protein BJ508DRAFT_308391 [Ascobolus immersus RN42]|uniref:Uncharacterized protein n=1 Tax=Ascobolus immersus RN42 TaxID=1160509 RepID=A0A3N4I243_ASCIM|nr:hypothetical protein BJ508DRAFT_308391 [Ascobolus immersus RN42]
MLRATDTTRQTNQTVLWLLVQAILSHTTAVHPIRRHIRIFNTTPEADQQSILLHVLNRTIKDPVMDWCDAYIAPRPTPPNGIYYLDTEPKLPPYPNKTSRVSTEPARASLSRCKDPEGSEVTKGPGNRLQGDFEKLELLFQDRYAKVLWKHESEDISQ